MSGSPIKKVRPYATLFGKQRRNRSHFYFLLSVAIALVVGFSLWLGLSQMGQSPGKWQDDLHPRTLAIASQFLCGACPCNLALSECPCGMRGGGLEELHFISSLLSLGMDEAQIVQRVHEKYGGFIEKQVGKQ